MKIYKYLLVLLVLIANNTANAQMPKPNGDSAWIYQPQLSDEFDTTAIRHSRWKDYYWGGTKISNGAEINYPTNLTFNDTTLKIKADTLDLAHHYYESDTSLLKYKYNQPTHGLTFVYSGGVLASQTQNYTFGYIEVYAKFPSKKYPLWPGPWLFGGGTGYYNEIDIAENDGVQTFLGNHVGNNYHVTNISSNFAAANSGGWDRTVLPSGDSLSGGFHKYALQWDPNSVNWYFDGVLTSQLYDTSRTFIPQHGMGFLLNFCVDPRYAYLPSDWDGDNLPPAHGNRTPTKWPQYIEAEYVRYYTLNFQCTTDILNLCTPSGYDRSVRRRITTNPACSPNFSPSSAASSYTLRATDYILLDEGTTINPSGTGAYFSAEIIGCP